MKTKLLILLYLMITCEICVLAQTEAASIQFRPEALKISSQLTCFNYSPIKIADSRNDFITKPAELDSPLIKLDSNYKAPEQYKTKIPKSLVLPALLIGYGLTTLGNHGLYSNHQARTDLQKLTGGKGAPIDNYLVAAPYVEFGVLLLLKKNCNSDLINTALLIAKSELLMLAITYPMKFITNEERPYSYYSGEPLSVRQQNKYAFQSMPSGHTAEAFVAATIVYREYRYLSPWYGIGAYALATTVGAYRMINDQHWMSDVFVGAGIGIASANIAYATHQHRWGRNGYCFTPTYDGKNLGGAFVYQFR